jgi:hypothetical protein
VFLEIVLEIKKIFCEIKKITVFSLLFQKNPKETPKNKQNIKKTATIRGVFENV